jgi:hypothetical protein
MRELYDRFVIQEDKRNTSFILKLMKILWKEQRIWNQEVIVSKPTSESYDFCEP